MMLLDNDGMGGEGMCAKKAETKKRTLAWSQLWRMAASSAVAAGRNWLSKRPSSIIRRSSTAITVSQSCPDRVCK